MRIDENEKISIWLAGNTGLRNPTRIQDGFIAFSQSPFVGNLHGRENELGFMAFLDEKGVINNESGKDPSGSHARKWRLMFERYGFIYGQAKSQNGFAQEELGEMDEITPFGRVFIKADTVSAMQECFLRSLGVEQYWLPDGSGHFSPFRWILAIMLELERRTGSSELSRIEFGLWGHTTNPSYDINEVVDRILDLRARRKNAPAKRPFDRREIEERGKHYDKKSGNFLDYSDMNMRYLRISGVLQRKGRGLIIVPSKHVIAEAMAKATASTSPMLDEFKALTTGAPLPTDNIDVAKKVLTDLMKQMKDRQILFDICIHVIQRFIRNQLLRNICEDVRKRKKQNGRNQTKSTVNVRNTAGIECIVPERIADDAGISENGDRDKEQGRCNHIIDNVDQAGADLLCLCSDPAYQESGQAVSDVNTDNNGKHGAEFYADRTGNRLENTDDSR